MYTRVKTKKEVKALRESCQITAKILQKIRSEVSVGATAQDMANLVQREIKGYGVQAAFLGYQGFPSVICISFNEEIVHGIPTDREIIDGDLVSFDFGVIVDGMISDSAITVVVGESNSEKDKLLTATEESLMAGIKAIKGPTHTGDIGEAVAKVLQRNKLGIVRDLVGHGVGHDVHEEPNIPNYGKAGEGDILQPGMTICIEPMATLGEEGIVMYQDGWTIGTRDQSLSAHFEHTVLITDDGYEILTKLNR